MPLERETAVTQSVPMDACHGSPTTVAAALAGSLADAVR